MLVLGWLDIYRISRSGVYQLQNSYAKGYAAARQPAAQAQRRSGDRQGAAGAGRGRGEPGAAAGLQPRFQDLCSFHWSTVRL